MEGSDLGSREGRTEKGSSATGPVESESDATEKVITVKDVK